MKRVLLLLIWLGSMLQAQEGTYEFVNKSNSYYSYKLSGLTSFGEGKLAVFAHGLHIYNRLGFETNQFTVNQEIPFRAGQLVCSDNNGGFYAALNDTTIYRFNSSLNIIDSIRTERQRRVTIIDFRNSKLYVLFSPSYSGTVKLNINIYTEEGELIDSSTYDYPYSLNIRKPHTFAVLENNKYGFCESGHSWHILDKDSQATTTFSLIPQIMRIFSWSNNRFLLVYKSKLEIVNSDGSLYKELTLNSKVTEIYGAYVKEDKILLYVEKNNINGFLFTDEEGNENFIIGGRGKYDHLYWDDAIYGNTIDDQKYYLLKANNEGEFASLQLNEFPEKITPEDSVSIKWYSNITDKDVNLFYNSEAGKKIIIAEGVPVERDSFGFRFNNKISIGNRLFIELADNISKYDYADFDLILFKGTNYINANNVLMWVGNNGMGSHDPRYDRSGFYWPASNLDVSIPNNDIPTSVFMDGALLGYQKNGEIRVQGSSFRYGLNTGVIYEDGSSTPSDSKEYNLFKIRENWQTLPENDLKEESRYGQRYWPVEYGAPWVDVNNDGYYDPEVDKPDIPGKELLFWSSTSADTARSENLYYSDPDNLEFHQYVFDLEHPDLKDVVFRRYKIFNKTNSVLDSVLFAMWSDPDLGDAADDYVGCDSSLGLAYCFNGDEDDHMYGTPPPAVGYLLVQGPLTEAPGQTAIVNGEEINGYANMPMFSFYLRAVLDDFDDYYFFDGAAEMAYNNMKGLRWDGSTVINEVTGAVTKFPFNGDPETETGWYDGMPGGDVPYDRRMQMAAGPFTMEPGDTQDVVIAILMAQGENRVNSVTKLKELSQKVLFHYNSNKIFKGTEQQSVKPPVPPPSEYTLSQNYPNPFNPYTTINFTLPEDGAVTLTIYNILGEVIENVINKEMKAGTHSVRFIGENLASGIYFYNLRSKNYNKTKKMVFMK